MKKIPILWVILFLVGLLGMSCSPNRSSIFGRWTFRPEKSTDLVTWRYRTPEVVIRKEQQGLSIVWHWMRRKKIAFTDSVELVPNGTPVHVPVTSPIWPENWYMGVLSKLNTQRTFSGRWLKPEKRLTVQKEQRVTISQGETTITTRYTYDVSNGGNTLTITEKRSSRPTPITYIFVREAK